jgi:hypothetical protein
MALRELPIEGVIRIQPSEVLITIKRNVPECDYSGSGAFGAIGYLLV